MNALVAGILLLALMNVAFKAVGPAVLSGRSLPPIAERLLAALGQGLLASLVATTLFGKNWDAFDPTILPGLVLAFCLRLAGGPALACAITAVVLTGLVRVIV